MGLEEGPRHSGEFNPAPFASAGASLAPPGGLRKNCRPIEWWEKGGVSETAGSWVGPLPSSAFRKRPRAPPPPVSSVQAVVDGSSKEAKFELDPAECA